LTDQAFDQTFDYVIVGAGSAGCVLAERLSRDGSTVCVLEAGPSDASSAKTRWLIKTPLGFLNLIRNPRFNWMYAYEAEDSLEGRALPCPRGKLLGGSSSINASHYVRGHRYDYDLWASLGCEGWDYDSVLPFFKGMERWTGPDSPYHGKTGTLTVGKQPDPHPANEAFLAAAQERQYRLNPDYNGAEQDGFGYYQLNQDKGERVSASRAFLQPALQRPNVTIVTDVLCRRVLVEEGVAVGVEVEVDGQPRRIAARGEVILSAGVIGSAQILLLSGIGPARQLASQGIDVVRDAPGVGENLQDHPITTVAYESDDAALFGISLRAAPWLIRAPFQYLFARRGPFTSSAFESGGFVRTSPDEPAPDLQLSFSPGNVAKLANGDVVPRGHGYSIHCALLRPKSRGTITLKSADPRAAPVIRGNFLDHPDDLETLVRGLRLTRQIALAPSLTTKYDPVEVMPGKDAEDQAELEHFIRSACGTAFHPVGTCKMGTDDQAVVDPRLKVYGIGRLRVADASIMPTLVGGNTNAPSMMIGEKAAAMIMEDRRGA